MAPRSLLLRYRWSVVWFVAAIGCAISLATWRFTERQSDDRMRAGFYARAQTQLTVAGLNLQRYEEMVYSLRDAFLSSESITREEFADLARDLLARHEGVQALEWVEVVPGGAREQFEREASASLGRPLRIMQRRADGTLAVAAPAPEYVVITYVEPATSNESAFGYDLNSAPSAPQIAAARTDRSFKISQPFRLIQSANPDELGITFILPFWRPQDPLRTVQGFLQGVFKLHTLLGQAHRLETNEALDTYYFEIDPAKRTPSLLYANFGGDEPLRAPTARVPLPDLGDPANITKTLHVGGREWLVVVRMNERWAAANTSRQPLGILGAGLAITLLLGYSLHILLNRASRIEDEVTERTAELAESERRLAGILSDMPGAAYRCGPQPPYPTTFVSDGVRDLCGHTAGELLNGSVNWDSLMHAQDVPAVDRQIDDALARHAHFEVEYRIRHADGSERHIWERGHGVFDSTGKLLGIEGLMVDVTARKQAEAHARAFDRQIVETQRLESLGVLAGGIAHDFNNLLTAVLGNASIARYSLPADHDALPQLEQIEKASRRAADLCTQMLAYAGRSRIATGHVDLSELVRDTAQLLEVTLRKNTRLHLDLVSPLPRVQADASQLRQIVMNLVINAADAIGEHSGEVSLRTFVQPATTEELRQAVQNPNLPAGRYVGLEVQDNGCGMKPEVLARIFEPFYTTKFSGRGLGLSAVLGIVRGHHGALFVDSQPGVGTTFRLLLPVAPDAAPIAAADMPLLRPRDTTEPLPRLQGTVLIVEDEVPVREIASLSLEMAGLEVLQAPDGMTALQLWHDHREMIDLILLDLTMPGLSGEETLARLRAEGATQKVIIYSGYSAPITAQRCAQLGAVAFLSKPFEVAVLLNEIRRHLPGGN